MERPGRMVEMLGERAFDKAASEQVDPGPVQELVVEISDTQSLAYRARGPHFIVVMRTTEPDPLSGVSARELTHIPHPHEVGREAALNERLLRDLDWYKHMLAVACDELIRRGVTKIAMPEMPEPPQRHPFRAYPRGLL